jgi:hypothetical protein
MSIVVFVIMSGLVHGFLRKLRIKNYEGRSKNFGGACRRSARIASQNSVIVPLVYVPIRTQLKVPFT